MSLFDFDVFDSPSFMSPGQPTYNFGGFRDDSFSSFMNPIQNLMPQTRSFIDELGRAPRMEDHRPSVGRGILAGLAGLAASFNSPGAGIEAATSIAGAPFNRAMSDYQTRIGALGQAARTEQGMLGLARQFGNDQFERDKFGQQIGFQRDQLGQQGQIANRELDIKGKDLDIRRQQMELERALNERRISIDQYQAATQRLNAMTNQKEAGDRAQYYKDSLNVRTQRPNNEPSAAMTELKLGSLIQADPVLSRFVGKDGSLQVNRMDESARQRLMQIYQEVGLVPKPNNKLDAQIPFNPMFNFFGQ